MEEVVSGRISDRMARELGGDYNVLTAYELSISFYRLACGKVGVGVGGRWEDQRSDGAGKGEVLILF